MSKSTEILNEILQKLSLLTKEDELAQGIEDIDVTAEELSSEEEEAPAVEEEAPAEEASEELSEEAVEAEEETQLMEGYVTEEAFASKIGEMEAKLAEMAKMLDEEMGYKKKSEELSSQLEKLSEEPAAEAIEHTPEAATEKKPVYNFGMQRPQNTLDRVFNRLTNK